jgi:hypothetical protein
MTWTQDENGLSRRSKYVDRAPKPVVFKQGPFGYYARQLDLIGELAFVLKRKGSPDRFECGVGLGFEKGDTVSALFGLSGIQIGLAKERSTTLTFPGGECKSCVAIMGLTIARLVEDRYYTRKKKLKARGTVRNVIRELGCEEKSSQDCDPKPDCSGCPEDPFMTSTLHEIAGKRASDSDQRTVSLAVESFESTHETSGGLLADCYDWMNASFAAEETDATSGVFVDVPWQRLTYLPPDLASGSFLPAVMISAGLDVEPLGGIALPRDEGFPLVFLVPRTNSVRLNSVSVSARADKPQQVGYLQPAVATLNSAPISILSTILAPMDGAALSGGRLQVLLSDQQANRSTLMEVPLATVTTD